MSGNLLIGFIFKLSRVVKAAFYKCIRSFQGKVFFWEYILHNKFQSSTETSRILDEISVKVVETAVYVSTWRNWKKKTFEFFLITFAQWENYIVSFSKNYWPGIQNVILCVHGNILWEQFFERLDFFYLPRSLNFSSFLPFSVGLP